MNKAMIRFMALMLVVVMMLVGCVPEKMEITINPDNSGEAKLTINLDKAFINEKLKEQGVTDKEIENYWKEFIDVYQRMGINFKTVRVNEKECLQVVETKKLRKGKLTQDLGLSDYSYITADTVYSEVNIVNFVPSYYGKEELALKELLLNSGITVDLSLTLPNDIVNTNGTVSLESKRTVNFSFPIENLRVEKKYIMFATTKSGITQTSIRKKVKAANTIAKPEIKKVKANNVKNDDKYASITVKWSKVKGAKKYEIILAPKKKWVNIISHIKTKYTKNNSITFKKLKKNKKYYIRVRAVKTNFAGSIISSKPAKESVRTKK